MKKRLLLTGLLLTLTVSVALAGGVNFNWGTVCYTENPVSAVTFACNTNAMYSLSWPMTASFVIDNVIPDFVGVEIHIEGQSDLPALPDWWKLGAWPDCRANRVQFQADTSSAPQTSCFDWTGGSAVSGFSYTWDTNRAHIDAVAAIPAEFLFDMHSGVEYYAGRVTILNSKTAGAGACPGCSAGMLWVLYSVVAYGNDGQREVQAEPIPGGNVCLSWNNTIRCCYGPTPARNTTWGQVKSLYR